MTQPVPTPPPGDPAPTPPEPVPTPALPGPPKDDKPLGPGGEKALAAEREARKALEKQLADLAPLKQLAGMLGGQPTGDGKTDLDRLTERLSQHETELANERLARWRAEVVAEKGISPALAARLQGATREELAADADALVALIPTAKPGTPAPDPSQGSRGGTPPDLDAQIAEAQKKGDVMAVIRLNGQKLAAQPK
ncbi:hypothetical protein ABGB07_02285 [Micromonosporaceae bacterium B7E4]